MNQSLLSSGQDFWETPQKFFNELNEHVGTGSWSINLPEDLEPLREEIEKCINENIPYGCCGGCL